MSKVLMESLKLDLPALAEMIRSKGRGKDTMLAHITPKEAALLKRRGGAGTINPDTGLPEFDDGEGFDAYAGGSEQQIADQNAANQTPSTPVSPNYDVVNQEGRFIPTIDTPQGPLQTRQAGTSFFPGENLPKVDPATGLTRSITPTAPGVTSPEQQAVQQPGTKPGEPSYGDRAIKQFTDPGNLARLGLTGALGAFGATQARRAGGQTQAATQEAKAIAQPYTEQGKTLVGAAQRGELTPQSQQVLAAYKAQQAQGVANRGGIGQQQADAATAALYSNLLDNQYKYGLQIMQIGDNITLGAIKSGLQLDQQLQSTTNNFYAQLASIAAGGTGYIPIAPSVQPTRA
jgi:hypothetical protein